MCKPGGCSQSIHSGTESNRTRPVAVQYPDAFKRQLKRLGRRYRRIREDVEPFIERLSTGETPGDRIPGVGNVL